jgi:hypothetical protein
MMMILMLSVAILKEWGGGGSPTRGDLFKTFDIYRDPADMSRVSTGAGYCVLNNITKQWRAGYTLGPVRLAFDASCPILRRGWDDPVRNIYYIYVYISIYYSIYLYLYR